MYMTVYVQRVPAAIPRSFGDRSPDHSKLKGSPREEPFNLKLREP